MKTFLLTVKKIWQSIFFSVNIFAQKAEFEKDNLTLKFIDKYFDL